MLLENRAFLVIWVISGKTGHFGNFLAERKFHLESGLNQREEAKSAVSPMQPPTTEARTQISAGGVAERWSSVGYGGRDRWPRWGRGEANAR